jgi:hypothetical protein
LKNGAQVQVEPLDANFDKRKALLEAAHLALTRALQSVPVVTKPQDFKALVDAANNAIKLVDAANNAIKLVEMMDRDRPAGDGAPGAARKRMFQVLEDIERRIRDAGKDAKLIEATVIDERPPAPITVESLPVASTMAETLAARRRQATGP